MDQATIISIVAICILVAATILVPIIQVLIDHKNAEKQIIYQAKREALIEALNFIDDYFSYLTWHDDGVPYETEIVRDQNCDVKNMTIRSRKILNLLCTYCGNKETIDLYLALLLHPTDRPTELLIKFKETCRTELDLSKVEFNKYEVLIAKVSTEKLENKSKWAQ